MHVIARKIMVDGVILVQTPKTSEAKFATACTVRVCCMLARYPIRGLQLVSLFFIENSCVYQHFLIVTPADLACILLTIIAFPTLSSSSFPQNRSWPISLLARKPLLKRRLDPSRSTSTEVSSSINFWTSTMRS